MTGKNILKTQLQSGVISKPSIAAVAQDSGAMHITLSYEEDRLGNDEAMQLQERKCKVVKYSTKCHQGTQTELFKPLTASMVVRKSCEDTQQKPL